MVKRSTVIKNETGIHARPAVNIVQAACKFQSNITISRIGEECDGVNAKNIILLLALELRRGELVEVKADGEDEQKAVDGLIALVDSSFGE